MNIKLALKELTVNRKQLCVRWAHRTQEHSSFVSDPR